MFEKLIDELLTIFLTIKKIKTERSDEQTTIREKDFSVKGEHVFLIDVEAGIEHFGRGVEQNVDINVDILILDHHLVRDQLGLKWLDDLSAEAGKQVYCAADFMEKNVSSRPEEQHSMRQCRCQHTGMRSTQRDCSVLQIIFLQATFLYPDLLTF